MSDTHRDTPQARFAELPGEALLDLQGQAIPDFLQGQLTCDTRLATEDHSVPGALCNPQGRVLADLRLLIWSADHCLLRLRGAIAEATAATLGTYARFSRIDCRVAPQWQVLGVWGNGAAAAITELGLHAPAAAGDVVRADWGLCVAAGNSRWELIIKADAMASIQPLLSTHCATATETEWRARELEEGLYRIGDEDSGAFTPQALNYDQQGLVSFRKGCYTGQEVVARLHYRGQAKKRLAVLSAAKELHPERGDAVTTEDTGKVGAVLYSLPLAPGSTLLAVELRVDARNQELRLGESPLQLLNPEQVAGESRQPTRE